jgi:hypothetical protein
MVKADMSKMKSRSLSIKFATDLIRVFKRGMSLKDYLLTPKKLLGMQLEVGA